MLIQVAVPPLPQLLTYAVPPNLKKVVAVGTRVGIPLGSRATLGFVVEELEPDSATTRWPKSRGFEIKPILEKPNPQPCFRSEQLSFLEWVANYYGDSLAAVIEAAIPPAVTQKLERSLELTGESQELVRGKVEQSIFNLLTERASPVSHQEITRRFRNSHKVIRRLEEKGIIKITSVELNDHYLSEHPAPEWTKSTVELDQEQKTALKEIVQAINASEFSSMLLHGVTGSGKTEVYIEAIHQVLAKGHGALVIVPEIALTPQLVDRFRARLGDNIAVLHSGLSKRARWDGWQALLAGRCQIGIGARSAVFAPVANLGIIVVDEEHDTSYKQSEGLRYHARDLALKRGQIRKCPVVLGSATPALETLHHSQTGRYKYLSLPGRHRTTSPVAVELIDLTRIKPWEMVTPNISPTLHRALENTISAGKQAFVLYNRRGFASFLQCDTCGAVMECPNCSVTLTYHQSNNALLCHYCSLHMVPPEFCPTCSADSNSESATPGRLQQRGAGTERVFEELQSLFPDVAIDRLDRDTATNAHAYRQILDKVRAGTTGILVGTQMIAKGHDLPGVTLVGVVDCDVGLHLPDFRAGERGFQLLTQVSGRAGRGSSPGRVLLQTRLVRHPSLVYTVKQDYLGFAKRELGARSELRYPPFVRLLRILATGLSSELAIASLEQIAAQLTELAPVLSKSFQVLGPSPAPLERLKNKWRAHLLIKSERVSDIQATLRFVRMRTERNRKVRIALDVDPQDLL